MRCPVRKTSMRTYNKTTKGSVEELGTMENI
jgi:hypothetical protein